MENKTPLNFGVDSLEAYMYSHDMDSFEAYTYSHDSCPLS